MDDVPPKERRCCISGVARGVGAACPKWRWFRARIFCSTISGSVIVVQAVAVFGLSVSGFGIGKASR
jgi:hypothetical protein